MVAARAIRGLAGAGCLLAAAGLGLALHQTRGEVGFDRLAARVIGPPSPVPGSVAVGLSRLADWTPTAIAFLVVAAAAAVLHRRARPVVAVAVTGVATQGLVLIGKALVDRTLFSTGPTYPSGHMAGASAILVLAVLVAAHRGRRTAWFVGAIVSLLPAATAVGAIWTQSHVWTDVGGGALAGAGVALVVWSALVPVAESRQEPPVSRLRGGGRRTGSSWRRWRGLG